MAEFKTVMKEYDRMCRSFSSDSCKDCPVGKQRGIFACLKWIFDNPYEGEELIMNWANEHPSKKNYQKFEEIFGVNPILMDWWNTRGADWLMEDYKEPKKEDQNG